MSKETTSNIAVLQKQIDDTVHVVNILTYAVGEALGRVANVEKFLGIVEQPPAPALPRDETAKTGIVLIASDHDQREAA